MATLGNINIGVYPGEKTLLYAANLSNEKPIIDPQMRKIASRAQAISEENPLQGLINFTDSVIGWVATGILVSPFFVSNASRASFLKDSAVCEELSSHFTHLKEGTDWVIEGIATRLANASQTVSSFVDSFGFSTDSLNVKFTPVESFWDGGYNKFLPNSEIVAESGKCAEILQGNSLPARLGLRLTNYFSQALANAKSLYSYLPEFSPAYVVAALGVSVFVASLKFDSAIIMRNKVGTQLNNKFKTMTSALKKLKAEMKGNPYLKTEVKRIAKGIVAEQAFLEKELDSLKLPALTPEAKRGLFNPLLAEAKAILAA